MNKLQQQQIIQKRIILHVDINSYFATVLQQENPHLRDKPIGIIKDVGRTCIIAASKEAKKYGVKVGERLKDARILCPQILAIPASFERYLDTTKRLQKIFNTIAPNVYIYSLDEAFIDISDCTQHLYQNTYTLAQQIQAKIAQELGPVVTANVGIGPNRLLAKLASEIAPKGTVLEITKETAASYLADISFDSICGIGHRLSKKLKLMGITCPYQIRFYNEGELATQVGPYWAKELLKIAYGEEPELLDRIDTPKKPYMQSVGRSITGFRLYEKPQEIKSILYNLCLEIIDKVRAMKLAGRHIHLSLSGEDSYWSDHITLQAPINHAQDLLDHIGNLHKTWPANFKIIRFSVRLSLLEPFAQHQLLPSWQHKEAVQSALDTIHAKYGLFTVHSATVSKKNLIRPEVTGFLGDRIYQLADS